MSKSKTNEVGLASFAGGKEKKMNRKQLERTFNDLNEEYTLEEIFEMFDIDPFQAFELAYDNGLIDDDILEEMVPSDT